MFHVWQVYLLIYWCRSCSLCCFLFWLYWSYDTEWLLPDLCILIKCLMLNPKIFHGQLVAHVSTNIENMSEVSLSPSLCMRRFVCIYTCINLKLIIVSFLKWTKYSILVALLILVELGCAAFLFFDKSWKEVS